MAGSSAQLHGIMKFRSFVLLSCMLLVPGAAMFSHHIPASLRKTVRKQVWEPAIGSVASALGITTQPEATPSVALTPPAPDGPPAGGSPEEPRPLWSPAPGSADIGDFRRDAEDHLARLGAVAFECTPTGDGSTHRCSCRVAADPSGQLQRVFHAAADDPRLAIQNLVGQVISWKERLASVPMPNQPDRGRAPSRLQ
jgi:hypothetical protein